MAKRKSLARVLATALVLAMLVPGIAHGAGQTSSANMGAGGVVSSAYNRLMGDPGAIIGLQLVPNTLTKKEKSEIEENGAEDAHYDEVGAATVKQYLYKYPDFFTVGELTSWTALIQTYNGQANAGYKNYFVDGTNKRSNTWPAKQFYTVRQGSSASTSWKPNLLSDELTDKQLEDLGNGKLNWNVVADYIKDNKSEIEAAIDKFVTTFSNTGNVATFLNGLLDYNATSDKAKLKNAATYLDVLIMVHYMAGSNSRSVIQSYLKTTNQAGSEEFAVVFIGSVVSWEDQANNFRDWYTLPTYYAAATGKGINNYQKILPDGITLRSVTEWSSRNSSSSGNYKARRAAYMSSLYKKYNAKGTAKSDSNSQRMMSMNQSAMWWSGAEGAIGGMSNWEAALSFNPTNLYGVPSGNTGYTYYSSMGAKLIDDDEYEIDGNIVITVDPQKKKVAPGDKTKVTVTVDLTSTQEQITDTEKAFKYAEKMGYKVNVTFDLKWAVDSKEKKAVENDLFFDKLTTPKTWAASVPDGSKSKQTLELKDVKWKGQFANYMSGKNKVKFQDVEVVVNSAATVSYKVGVKVEVVNGTTGNVINDDRLWFKALGDIKKGEVESTSGGTENAYSVAATQFATEEEAKGKVIVKYRLDGKLDGSMTKEEEFEAGKKVKASSYKKDIAGYFFVKADPTSVEVESNKEKEIILDYESDDPNKGKVEALYYFNKKKDDTKTQTKQYGDGKKVKYSEFKEDFSGYTFQKAEPEEVTVKKGTTQTIKLYYTNGGGGSDGPEGEVTVKYRFDGEVDDGKTVTETFPDGTVVTGDDFEEEFEGYEYEGSTPEEVTVDPSTPKEIILDYKSLGKVTIKYRFDGEVDDSKTVEGYFPEGEEVKGSDYEEEFEGFEYVGATPETATADPKEPKEIILDYRTPPALPYGEEEHYYSEPEGAYVEIKEGSPGHETFEAMAGVPTTENLYIGAGATEFMLNMDVKHEISEGNPTRDYTLTYTATNCAGVDTKCQYSCPGHKVTFSSHNTCAGPHSGEFHSCSSCGGGSTTVYCNKPGQTVCASENVDCPGHEVTVTNSGQSWSISVVGGSVNGASSGTLWGEGHKECVGKDGSKDFAGVGCVHTPHTNTTHTHTHVFEGVINQPVDPFTYIDIQALNLWQVNAIKLESPEGLFKTPVVEYGPNTGYYTFYSQEGYQNNNGRLWFDFRWKDGERFGNTTTETTVPDLMLFSECDKASTEWMNETVEGVEVQATVVSDYVVLETTKGYQVPSYHQYTSDRVLVTTERFEANGSKNCQDDGTPGSKRTKKTITGDTITFSDVPDWEKKWVHNPMSTEQWDEDGYGIVRSGYNGNYAAVNTKWNNIARIMTPYNPVTWLGAHPNAQDKEGSKDFRADGFANTRLTYIGLDIIDSTSTDSSKAWSAEDGVEPVSNGIQDTGIVTLRADKEVAFNVPAGGVDYGTAAGGSEASDGGTYLKTLGYTGGQPAVNDIVVYDPVSTQHAIVVCNDKKYDGRTQESLAEGGDPELEDMPDGCPRDASCQYSTLACTDHGSIHTEDCFVEVQTGMRHLGGLNVHEHTDACYTNGPLNMSGTASYEAGGTVVFSFAAESAGSVSFWSTWNNNDPRGQIFVNGVCRVDDDDSNGGLNFRASSSVAEGDFVQLRVYQYGSKGSGTCNWAASGTCGVRVLDACDGALNKHVCTAECSKVMSKELVCDDPHHHLAGEPWDYSLAKNHYDFGDTRCWSPCSNDTKHIPQPEVSLGNGQVATTNDTFINLDREFRIYFPDLGDFAQSPTLHGIATTSVLRGMGYTDNMDTYKWVRNKFVTLPVNVIWYSATGESQSFYAGQRIDLDKLEYDAGGYGWYTFYAVLSNTEAINAAVQFDAIAVNAEEVDWYRENAENRNLSRTSRDCAAKHTAYKVQLIDIVGSMGSLAINDTGDLRFSNLFKTTLDPETNGWLVDNLIPKVDYRRPAKVVADLIDVRGELAAAATKYHDTYGTLTNPYGGKGHEFLTLPLTPAMNNLPALRNQPLRPGYQLYMDVETTGNYYGENRNANGHLQDNNLYYKMQITPRYWELDLDTGEYKPVDVYFGLDGNYRPAAKFYSGDATDWYYYVDWTEESTRRNYTDQEKQSTATVVENFSDKSGEYEKIRQPQGKDVIGTASRLFLNDMNRTFIGNTETYAVNRNPQDAFANDFYMMQAQRWHFTLGLPSSAVFVYANEPCTTANIETIQKHNSVIVCSLDIKVKGDVWTLEYDGAGINYGDNGAGIQVEDGGKVYPPPTDPESGKPLDDPIVTVYTNEFTSKDDLNTEGSH